MAMLAVYACVCRPPMDRSNKQLDNTNIFGILHGIMKNIPTYALYGEKPVSVLPEQLHCESLASRSRLHNWEIGAHRHEHFLQILYIRGGSGQARLGPHTVALSASCAVLVPAGHVHGFRFSSDIDGHIVTTVQSGVTSAIMAAFKAPALYPLEPNAVVGPRIATTFDMLVTAFGQQRPWRLTAIRAALTLLLAQLSELPTGRTAQARIETRAQRHARRFHELLEGRFREQRDIGYYADQLGITATQLNRICRAELGLSALGVIQRRLMAEAERDLAYTSLSIKEVALTLGFLDAAYFSRYFSRHAGMTPTAYRHSAHARFSGAAAHAA